MRKTIYLNLFIKWFVMVCKLIKKEEYRKITPYWCNRLLLFYGVKMPVKWWEDYFKLCGFAIVNILKVQLEEGKITRVPYRNITFDNGYKPLNVRPRFEIDYTGLEIGEGNPDWGAEEGKQYFILKLGKIVSEQNVKAV